MRVGKGIITLTIALCFIFPANALAYSPRQHRNIAVIQKVGTEHGLGTSDKTALVKLAVRESGLSSTPRTGSYGGLFQLRIVGWIAKYRRWQNPAINTEFAIHYIQCRYKTPRRALSHSYRYGWY
jgi:hypothetical protein